MIAAENRNAVFYEIKDSLSQKRALVYNVFKEIQPCTAKDVLNYLNKDLDPIKDKNKIIPINQISGRITELKKLFLIIEHSQVTDENTRCKNTEYRTLSGDERISAINKEYQVLTDEKALIQYQYSLMLKNEKRIDKEISRIGELLPESCDVIDVIDVNVK